jgi:phosphoglycerate dehydrogenase-like enzyme
VILTNCELPATSRRRLRILGPRYVIRHIGEISESELSEVEIMLIDIAPESGRAWLSKEKTSAMTKLSFVQSTRAGIDSVDIDELPRRVKICGNVGAYSLPMAEHTLGMMIDLAKGISQRNWKLRNGVSDVSDSLFLKGKTLGVIGAGGIGQAIAKLAKCLGMITLGVNTSGKRARHFDATYKHSRMDEVLKSSDAIVVTLPLTVRTFHLINASKLEMMKRNCILINVGRGHVVDEKALYYHLKNHLEFKCGLDVWWHYPKPGEPFAQKFPFFELPNFLGTPHVSGFVPEEKSISLDFAIDNIFRYVHRKKLLGLASRRDYLGLHELIASSKTS